MSAGSHEIVQLQRELDELKNKIAAAEQEGDKTMVRALIGLQTAVQEKQNLLLKAKLDGTGDASLDTQCTSVRAPFKAAAACLGQHCFAASHALCFYFSLCWTQRKRDPLRV
jgi:cell division septum initiation protein DivIVA